MTAFRFSRVESEETFPFSCGKPDLNTFFEQARPALESGLFLVSYKLCLASGGNPVVLVCLANDVIKNNQIYPQPPAKWPFENNPAIRIAAFGVADGYRGKGVGQAVILLLQSLFVLKNRTGCRYMTVDAYLDTGTPLQGRTVNFYQKYCGFVAIPVHPNANPGKIPKPKRKSNGTAPLYYDLNKMKMSLEADSGYMEGMKAAQKDMAGSGIIRTSPGSLPHPCYFYFK